MNTVQVHHSDNNIMVDNENESTTPAPKKENVHIPRYIKNQPWFYKDSNSTESGDYLIHHRHAKKSGDLDIDNNAEPRLGSGIRDEFEAISVKRKRGMSGQECTNCGSSDHKRADCLERPRKAGRPAELQEVSIAVRKDSSGEPNWDARKDRWYGYTGAEYDNVIKGWEKKNRNKNDQGKSEVENDLLWDTDEEVELLKLGLYKDSMGTLKQDDTKNSKLQRASVRLREDRAAYLNDVHSNEIKYDPKSRLYKSESLGSVDEKSNMFRRHLTGEAQELSELNQFSRDHSKKLGIRDEVEDASRIKHVLVANPTKYEQMLRAKKKLQEQVARKNDLSELDAKTLKGTAQSEKTKKQLRDLYG